MECVSDYYLLDYLKQEYLFAIWKVWASKSINTINSEFVDGTDNEASFAEQFVKAFE